MMIAAFFVALAVGIYGFCWLGHRFEPQMGALLDRWWGVPTVLIGGPLAILGFAGAVAGLFA